MTPADPTPTQTETPSLSNAPVEEPLATDDLVEEVSIDGMCGVY